MSRPVAVVTTARAPHPSRPAGARPLDLSYGDYHHRGGRDVPPQALSAHEVLIGYLIARGADYDIAVAARIGYSSIMEAARSSGTTTPFRDE